MVRRIYGTWYHGKFRWCSKHPALSSLKRALTYCFGSITFGSLIVSLIQLLRQFISILRSNFAADGTAWGVCGMIILDFFVGFIDWLVRYFNKYAYCCIIRVKSAKDTFDLIRFKGMTLINDMFHTALNLYSLFVAYLVALLAYLYLKFTKPEYNSGGAFMLRLLPLHFNCWPNQPYLLNSN